MVRWEPAFWHDDACLYAERTAAAAGAFHIRVIELKPGTLKSLNVIDLYAVQVHFAHLIHEHLDAVEFVNVISRIFLVVERHVVAESGASTAHHGDAQSAW